MFLQQKILYENEAQMARTIFENLKKIARLNFRESLGLTSFTSFQVEKTFVIAETSVTRFLRKG